MRGFGSHLPAPVSGPPSRDVHVPSRGGRSSDVFMLASLATTDHPARAGFLRPTCGPRPEMRRPTRLTARPFTVEHPNPVFSQPAEIGQEAARLGSWTASSGANSGVDVGDDVRAAPKPSRSLGAPYDVWLRAARVGALASEVAAQVRLAILCRRWPHENCASQSLPPDLVAPTGPCVSGCARTKSCEPRWGGDGDGVGSGLLEVQWNRGVCKGRRWARRAEADRSRVTEKLAKRPLAGPISGLGIPQRQKWCEGIGPGRQRQRGRRQAWLRGAAW